ncbi:MAG: 7,8-didemethyl-8-hydroxy-5-deazariboflavin synthase CofG [bacterium]|nr:7,8-didemethyl-8-hydroxy-5-deazariboflavin synthase CofG [bacterium]
MSTQPVRIEEASRLIAEAMDAGTLERAAAERLAASLSDPRVFDALLEAASESKRRGKGDVVTVSKNIFIPLTNLCRNRCSYCTCATPPGQPDVHNFELDEVARAVAGGVKTGCIEALFCLGDKPEIAYRYHRDWLAEHHYGTTTDYLVESCQIAFEAGMLPHTNAGILDSEEMTRLRASNASLGLMLESTSQRLRRKGGPHFHSPDKEPARRLRMHAEAGELRIPFTSGLLLGIGETLEERVDTLLAIRDLHVRYGHIQEVIVQPFHPKPDTKMRDVSPISDREVAGWVALARLVYGPEMNIQAPPNLAPQVLEMLLRSGLNDWGGVSPVTVDFINPEAPWPELAELRARTESAGQVLRERLPVYPNYIEEGCDWFDAAVFEVLPRFADAKGFARGKTASGVEAARCSNDSRNL